MALMTKALLNFWASPELSPMEASRLFLSQKNAKLEIDNVKTHFVSRQLQFAQERKIQISKKDWRDFSRMREELVWRLRVPLMVVFEGI
jgi:hypothetical protein